MFDDMIVYYVSCTEKNKILDRRTKPFLFNSFTAEIRTNQQDYRTKGKLPVSVSRKFFVSITFSFGIDFVIFTVMH